MTQHTCTCTAGKAFCQHQVVALYQLAHYQAYNIVRVPEIVTSTSAPQKWNVPPRTHGFPCRQMSDIKILKPTVPENDSPPQKRKCCGVSCNAYNPLNVPLCELRIRDQLMPTLLAHDPASQMVVFVWVSRQRPSQTLTTLHCQLAVSVFGILSTQEQQVPFLATGTGFIQLHSEVSTRQGQRGTGLIHTCIHCFYVNIKPLRDPQWVGSPRYNSNVTLCGVKEHAIFNRRCQENLFHVQSLC